MAWITSGVVVDPKPGVVLLDSGQLAVGVFQMPLILVTVDSRLLISLEWRNAANAVNRQSHVFVAEGTAIFDLRGTSISLLTNERVRVVTVGETEGRVQVSALT